MSLTNPTFSASTYQHRRQSLLTHMKTDGLMLFLGHQNSPINYEDNYYPFRQDSSFLYYAGLNLPHLTLLIDGASGESYLFGDDIDIEHIVWMGVQPSMEDLCTQIGIEKYFPSKELSTFLDKALAQSREVHFLPPYRAENKIQLSNLLHIPVSNLAQRVSVPLIEAVVAQREIKEAQEIEQMHHATTISGHMHHAVMENARPGIKESYLVGILQQVAAQYDCQLAYTPILTINGQTLHNHSYQNTLQAGQLLLGDFGASNNRCYAGDITRTVPVDQQFSAQQKEIYQLVLDTENKAINELKAGVAYREIHLNAGKNIAEGLKNIGLMKGDIAAAVEAGAHALFFPHGLGHQIGLDVHDMEDLGENRVGYGPDYERSPLFGLKSLRLAKKLQAGMVLTVEPGIYFIPELIDRWKAENKFTDFIQYEALEAYRTFGGIRIEDDVLVTVDGHRVLGEPIAKTVEDVEKLRAKA